MAQYSSQRLTDRPLSFQHLTRLLLVPFFASGCSPHSNEAPPEYAFQSRAKTARPAFVSCPTSPAFLRSANDSPFNAMDSQGRTPDSEAHSAALVNVELGLGYLAQGQMARAKCKLNHAVLLSPHSAEPHSARAYFLESIGEQADAEKEYVKAIQCSLKKNKVGSHPRKFVKTGAVYNNYATFLCRHGRFKEAEVAFTQALHDKSYERSAEVYENAGICSLQWAEQPLNEKNEKNEQHEKGIKETLLKRAKQYFKTALRHDPTRIRSVLEIKKLEAKS